MNLKTLQDLSFSLLQHKHLSYLRERLEEKDSELKAKEEEIRRLGKKLGINLLDVETFDFTERPWNNYAFTIIELANILGMEDIEALFESIETETQFEESLNIFRSKMDKELEPLTFLEEPEEKIEYDNINIENNVIKGLADFFIEHLSQYIRDRSLNVDQQLYNRVIYSWQHFRQHNRRLDNSFILLIKLANAETDNIIIKKLANNLLLNLISAMLKEYKEDARDKHLIEVNFALSYKYDTISQESLTTLVESVFKIDNLKDDSDIIKLTDQSMNIKNLLDRIERGDNVKLDLVTEILNNINEEIEDKEEKKEKCECKEKVTVVYKSVPCPKKQTSKRKQGSPRKQVSPRYTSSERCKGFNKTNGERCGNKATVGNYCHIHSK
jgi:hypothetical protein